MQTSMQRLVRSLAGLLGLLAVSGCNAVVLNPSGDVAIRQRDEIVIATVLMLLIILPVMALTAYFAWRYRASNKKTEDEYDPEWHHSTSLELVIWAAPLLIIIFLGAVTWTGTHLLDPYRPLDRINASQTVPATTKPLDVQVIALDWKWLFIYPQYGIATVNEVAAPVDRPIRFSITAQTMMDSFFVPAIAGQIYAMPGMQTTLNAVANKAGDFGGFSANLSGLGFSGMTFRFLSMPKGDFGKWVEKARASKSTLDRATYLKLATPSENVPVQYYGTSEKGLFNAVLNRCVRAGQTCMRAMLTQDSMASGHGMKTTPGQALGQTSGTGN